VRSVVAGDDPDVSVDWEPGDRSLSDRLWLADWRIQVNALYADVRGLAETDLEAALAHWRTSRERLFRDHPQSPVPASLRPTFRAHHFDHDPALRFTVPIEPAPPPAPGAMALELPNSGQDTLSFSRLGRIQLPLPDGARSLSVFWMAGYAGGLFIPFRDGTNGVETYPAGRYLIDGAKGADLGGDAEAGTITVDFNFAYQPSCAFDPRWACPLAPPENRLDIRICAGERLD
jgi:uncharacterized protein (DUF1684 family)